LAGFVIRAREACETDFIDLAVSLTVSHRSPLEPLHIRHNIDKLIVWWGKGIFVSLCASIVLLGTGPLDSSLPRVSVSAWSVSRTTFFLWLIWKLLIWIRYGTEQLSFPKHVMPIPLVLFFACVTLSLIPNFHGAGDYRYFFFGAMHYLMILDLFSDQKRWRLLFCLLALVPGLLAVRGILYDPSVLALDHMRRFGYPLPHPNIAGYLFAMTIPLCLAMVVGETGRLRVLSLLSCGAQLLALILTYSRGSWVGWGVSMLFFTVMLKRRREIGVVVVVAGLLLSFATPLQDRLSTLVRPQTDFSINERLESMEAGLKLGLDHPVLGVGYGRGRLRAGLRELHLDTATDITRIAHTHNVYVELFAETGLLGLGTFLWLLCQALSQTLINANRFEGTNRVFQLGIAAAWIAFAVTALGDVPFFHHEIRILFFTLLALTHLYSYRISWPLQVHAIGFPPSENFGIIGPVKNG
jgi:putative inorganic carbon (hco3(-)) transporter